MNTFVNVYKDLLEILIIYYLFNRFKKSNKCIIFDCVLYKLWDSLII